MPNNEEPTQHEHDLETQFPSLDLAYQIAVASYETSQKRFDAVDSKNQSLTTFSVTTFLAFPTIAKALGLSFISVAFVVALMAIAVSIILGIYSLRFGTVERLDPSVFFEKWLDKPPGQFKKDVIFFAGQAAQSATATIEQKWKLHTLAIICFFVSVFFASVWLATA